MERAFTIHLQPFAPLLKNERIAFREINKRLVVGNNDNKPGWILYISCKTVDTIEILKRILSILKKSNVCFILIKDQLLQYALNAGAYGNNEVGKVMSIYPKSENQAIELASELCNLTDSYRGPVIPEALKLGNIIYAQFNFGIIDGQSEEIKSATNILKNCPFNIPQCFRLTNKRKRIIGKYYVPVQLLASSPKGDIYKAICLKKLAFNWCLIKQGKPAALDDHFNREMKDRLLWQKEVLKSISNHVITPKVIDYFEKDGSSYLVMDFVEGINLGKLIFEKHKGTTWRELTNPIKIQLMQWFQKAIDLVVQIHKRGFVHRDITDSNFLVLPDGNLCIIDFELSYDIENQLPNPPFVLGSYGYAAPEQLQYAVPDPKEDVYSMGALLCFLLSGLQPVKFINENPSVTTAKLYRLSGDLELTRLVSRCLHLQRKSRPDLETLREGISKYLLSII
jgi:serine/threonine protein kinase